MKKLLLSATCMLSLACFAAPTTSPLDFLTNSMKTACPNTDTSSGDFCSVFPVAAVCYCNASFPPAFCQSAKGIYDIMMARFGGDLNKACEFQKETTQTPVQKCIDSWNCYIKGGNDSTGRPCNASGASCV